ncbi:BRO family protein [Lacrimispora indolis]|uniref:BRO family protein n=1 Tax=Lacrimispora indolis TaxID=69825 RepID=UPI0004286B12|nr:BRO family protein [[Clostridium] methoxybenzovorans]
MSKLKLITTEKFGEIECNFYRNRNDEILLTREQIGTALEYSNPQKAIDNIHRKHKNRLDTLSVTLKVRATDNKEYDTVLYSERGIMELCRWSRQPKANQFMDWVWDIVEKYRNNELIPNMKPITDAITTLAQTMTTLTTNITTMQQDIHELKQSQKNRYLLEKRYPSAWYKKTAPKYKLLQEYFDCSRSELYSNIYKELEDTYDVDINQIHEDYCYENHLLKDECYPMDAIEHDSRLRDVLTLLIDSSLLKFGLQTEDEIKNFKRKTLFDREPDITEN